MKPITAAEYNQRVADQMTEATLQARIWRPIDLLNETILYELTSEETTAP